MDLRIRIKDAVFLALGAVFLVALQSSCTTDRSAATASGEKVVNVYNWADYIAPDTLEKFEAEYGTL